MKRFKLSHLTLCLSILIAMNTRAETSHTLELLGEPQDARLLIIHADDAGMSNNVNHASIDALKKGIVTSSSVMMPCPWVPGLVQMAKENPGLDLGIHLTMNSEWGAFRWAPLAPRNEVPGLIDEQGYMHKSVMGTIQAAKPEEVGKEVRAQIEHALRLGLKPSHLDSHMGTLYYHPGFFQATMQAAEEYDIPFMLMNMTERNIKRWGKPESFDEAAAEDLKKRGYPMIDALLSIQDVPAEQSRAWYEKTIRSLEPGVNLLIIHVGLPGPELSTITNAHRQREMDYEIFTDPAMRKLIEDEGIKLISWKDLKAVWDRRQRP